MKVVDTSVVVAAFASWHEFHRPAVSVLQGAPSLTAQGALEAYAVLTRLPPPHRAPPLVVRDFLAANFPGPCLTLTPERLAAVISQLAEDGIVGGASYDALIAATTRDAGGILVTCDRRAQPTYQRIGVAVEYLTET